LGGDFTTVTDTVNGVLTVNYVAIWDGSNNKFGSLSTGVNGIVKSLAFDQSNNNLYLAGNFTTSNSGTAMNYIGYWNANTSTFNNVGVYSGIINNNVNTIELDISNNLVYFGGDLCNNVIPITNNQAVYNTVTQSLGQYTTSSTSSINQYTMNLPLTTNGTITDTIMDTSRNLLYICGNFTTVTDLVNGTMLANSLAVWDLSNNVFSALTSYDDIGVNGPVKTLVLDISNNNLYFGGNFSQTSTGSLLINNIGYWNATNKTYNAVGYSISGDFMSGYNLNNQVNSLDLDISRNLLYIGGDFTTNNIYAGGLCYYNASNNGIGAGIVTYNTANLTNGTINSTIYDGSNNLLYIAGSFSNMYTITQNKYTIFNNIGIWNMNTNTSSYFGGTNNNLPGVNGNVFSISLDVSNNRLYFGGNFYNSLDNIVLNNIGYINLSSRTFSPLFTINSDTNNVGVNGQINTTLFDTKNYRLYLGGSFQSNVFSANTLNWRYIPYLGYWNIDSSNFTSFSVSRLNGNVNAFALDVSRNLLYFGGEFTSATANVQGISLYKPTQNTLWQLDYSTTSSADSAYNYASVCVQGKVFASAFDSSRNLLYLGGKFATVSDASNQGYFIPANNVIIWDISNSRFKQLYVGDASSTGLNGTVYALAIDQSNNHLYIGGNIISSNTGTLANHIGYFDVNRNTYNGFKMTGTLSYGLNSQVLSFELDTSFNRLYFAGNFTSTSGNDFSMNYIGYWDITANTFNTAYSLALNGNVNSLQLDRRRNLLYFGGSFTNSAIVYPVLSSYNSTTAVLGNLNLSATRLIKTNGNIFASVFDSSRNLLYLGGDFTSVVDPTNQNGLSANYIAVWDVSNVVFRALQTGSFNGVDAPVNALVLDQSNNILYFGGSFTYGSTTNGNDSVNGITLNNIGYWNVSNNTFNAMQFGVNTTVNVLSFNSKNNVVYLGGSFTSSNAALTMNYLGYWTKSTNTFTQLPNLNGNVDTLAIDTSRNVLYFGGEFTNSTLSVQGITSYNPTSLAIGNVNYSSSGPITTNGNVFASVFDSSRNLLYIAGDFTYVTDPINGQINANYIAIWDNKNLMFKTLQTGDYNGVDSSVNSLALDQSNNILYFGGSFKYGSNNSSYNGIALNYIGSWNISIGYFRALSIGLNKNVTALTLYNSNLYIGGKFTATALSDVSMSYIGYWNTSSNSFSALSDSGLNNNVNSMSIDKTRNLLYFGGAFTSGSINVGGISSYNQTSKNIGKIYTASTSPIKTNGNVFASAFDASRNLLYLGGDFTNVIDYIHIGGLSANRIVIWDISNQVFKTLQTGFFNGVDGSVNSLALDNSNNILYLGGSFKRGSNSTSPTGVTLTNIGIWNINTSTFTAVGSGVDNTVHSLLLNSSLNSLYVGGSFINTSDSTNGTIAANRITTYNRITNKFTALKSGTYNGLTGNVYALTFDTKNNYLYFGGDFSNNYSNNLRMDLVGIWDVSNQVFKQMKNGTALGLDVTRKVFSMTMDNSNSILYVGGSFQVTSLPIFVNYITYCNINGPDSVYVFKALVDKNGITGLNGNVKALSIDISNNLLYFGGTFTATSNGSTVLNYSGSWNLATNTFSTLNSNYYYNGAVNSLTMDSKNSTIYLGGNFTSITKSMNYIGQFNISTKLIGALQTGSFNGVDNVVNSVSMDSSNNLLYFGGSFINGSTTTASTGTLLNRIGYWNVNQSNFNSFNTNTYVGLDNAVNAVSVDISNNIVYLGGSFTNSLSGIVLNYSGLWNIKTNVFSPLVNNYYYNGKINTITFDSSNNVVYYGGNFTNVVKSLNHIAYMNLNNNIYYALQTGYNNGVDGNVNSLAFDQSNNLLYFGGSFLTATTSISKTGVTLNRIGYWNVNSSTFNPLRTGIFSGVDNTVSTLSIDVSRNLLYLGGSFMNSSSSVILNNAGLWNVSTNTFSTLNNSIYTLGSKVNTISLDIKNNILYLGATLINLTVSLNRLGYINLTSQTYYSLQTAQSYNGVDNTVNTLSLDISNNKLYFGGAFVTASNKNSSNGLTLNKVGVWNANTSTFYNLSAGLNNTVNAVKIDISNNLLYLGGSFTKSTSDLSMAYAGVFNISSNSYSSLNNNSYVFDSSVNTIHLDSSNNLVYFGGNFNKLTLSLNRICYMNLN